MGTSWEQRLEDHVRELAREHPPAWLEGFRRGYREGCALTVIEQIGVKFGQPSEAIEREVRTASLGDLQRWTLRMLTADSVEALLR